jgi:NAD(P)-dependent dehydrogenase (short-subunit alcohol dehydrogenase family)
VSRSSQLLLADRVCLVAGAASPRGIGHAVVQLFAEHGAKVFAVDRSFDEPCLDQLRASVNGEGAAKSAMSGARCDVRSLADCTSVVEQAVSEFGRIDCLVNTVGVVRAQPLLDIEQSDFDEMVNVNLKGAFNLCQAVLRRFADQGHGSIINIASVAAERGGGLMGGAHYAASKGGIISLTRTIAREFGPIGIRANTVCPSMTQTSMIDGVSAATEQEVIAQVPLRRLGRPSDIAGACLFLASDLSAYVTGATIDVNGGFHIH